MDLTPEERQRIYEEEKTRLEAQEQIKKEMAAKEAAAAHIGEQRAQSALKKGCLKGCLVSIAVMVGLGLLFAVVEQWPKWFPSAKDRAWEASSAKRFKITESLDASREALKQRAAVCAMADMIEEMQALFEARWRELHRVSAQNKADTSMDEIHKESVSKELIEQRRYVSDVLRGHAEFYHRDRIKGKSVQSVIALGKEIKVGDTEAYVKEVFPFDEYYEVYDRLDSRGDEAHWLWEHLYITPDLTLEVTFSRPSKVVRLFVRDSVPVSEQRPQLELGDKVASIAIRGKQIRVGDTADAVFAILTSKDRVMRPTVESDPKDAKSLKVIQHYRVEGKRFDVVLSRPEATGPYKVETIALLK
jgi:hypothetical protein